MLPLTISYNYEIVYHRQKERESLKSPFPCCFDRFLVFYISLWHTFLQNPRTETLAFFYFRRMDVFMKTIDLQN